MHTVPKERQKERKRERNHLVWHCVY